MTKRLLIALASVLGALALAASAWAHFTAVGSGSGNASVGSLNAPAKPSASANGTGRVDINWHRATLSNGTTPAGHYYVSRFSGATLDGYACGTSPSGATIPQSAADGSGDFSCSDTGLTNAGPYTYTVTAVYKSFSAETAKSDPVTVSLVGPLDHFLVSAATTTPTAGAGDNLTITAKDASNNTVTSYTGSHNFTFSGAGSIGSNNPTVTNGSGTPIAFGSSTAITFTGGVSTVSSGGNGAMTLYKAETASIVVSDGTHTNGSGLSVTVTAAAADRLALVQQPTATVAGQTITPAVTVAIRDQFGNQTSSTANVTVAPSSQTLSGTLTKSAVNGLATFDDLSMTKAGSYTLSAGSSGLSGATSDSFNISPAAANKLAFTVQPSSTAATQSITPAPAATVQDQFSNTVTSSSASVTVAIGTNPASGTLSGTKTVNAGSGVATFPGLSIDKAGTGYTLTASSTGLTGDTSAAFNITAGTATKLQLAAATTTPAAGAADNLTITALDAGGNTATSYAGSKNLTFGGAANAPDGTHPTVTNSAGAAVNFGSTTAIDFTNGQAQVSSGANGLMKLFKAETTSIAVSDGTINNNPGLSVTVSAAAPSVFQFTNCSLNGAAAVNPCPASEAVGSNPGHVGIHVTVLDTWRNTAKVTASALTVTLSNSSPANYTITGTPVVIAVGASESGAFTVTHQNNANNNTVVSTTNAGFTQASITVQK